MHCPTDPADEWWHAAECRGMGVHLFFGPSMEDPGEHRESRSERTAREMQAIRVCAQCRVRPECLAAELAMDVTDQNGVVGGMVEDDRRALIRSRRRGLSRAA